MIALDTNVLVRWLVDDDPVQSEAAARTIDAAARRNEELWIANVVVCELVWVLRGIYRLHRDDIAASLDALLHAREMVFESRLAVAAAVAAYQQGKGDLADHLLLELASAAGCKHVLTFDGELLGRQGFRRP